MYQRKQAKLKVVTASTPN